jgi:hypothetical protein
MQFFQQSLARYLFIAVLALLSTPAFAQVSISVDIAPPALPVYEQPACPNDGYLWTPGYWAYGDYGYYWVPGTWVQPPEAGLLWTPGYWGWSGNDYAFYPGYWGANVGFYGGVNYGYGYGGDGYGGGRWQGGNFFYNTSVNNIGSANVRNRYADATAVSQAGSISYNGGAGGVQAQASAQQRQFASERHVQPTSVQVAHVRAASNDRGQLASANGGRPATPAAVTPTSYNRVAKQNAATQPLTKQDSLKEQQASTVQNNMAPSPRPQINPEKQSPPASQNPPPTESRDIVAQPGEKPVVMKPQTPVYNTEPRPEAPVATQPHPETVPPPQPRPEAVPPQSRPQAEAPPQPRPEAGAKTQSQPEAGVKPQGQSGKPQPN